MRRQSENPLPFLGGPISAALVALCLEPFRHRVLPWFALVPFFLSLHRQRAHPFRRIGHGISFGLLLACFGFAWLLPGVADVPADAPPAVRSSSMGWFLGACALLAAQSGIFALGAGPVLRSSRRLASVLGLPVLWTGLDVLRGEFLPLPSRQLALWPSVGYCISAESPEARVASLAGAYGLGFAVVLSAAIFALAFREGRFWRQSLLAGLGILVPLGCSIVGAAAGAGENAGTAHLAIVASAPDSGTLLEVSSRMRDGKADLAIWSRTKIGALSAGSPPGLTLAPGIRDFVQRTGVALLAGATSPAGRLQYIVLDRQARVVLPGGWPPRDEEGAGSVDLPFGRVSTLEGIPSPARVRRTAGAEPGILVVSSEDPFPAGRFGRLQRLTVERYRAIENRKWVVHSAPESVMLLDAEGRIAMQFQGSIPSAGIEKIEILGTSPYARWGWRIEPLCTALACMLLLAGALRPAFRRHRDGESPPQRQ